MFSSEAEILRGLLQACQVLSANHWLIATDGNVSARFGERGVLITRAGLDKRGLDESSFVELGLDESASREASSEWPLHRSLYASRGEIGCVLHVHSPFLTSFAVAHSIPSISLLAEAMQCIEEIVLVPYCEPGSRELGDVAVRTSTTAGVYLLANHGVVSVGRDVKAALYRLERAEFLARVQATAGILGGGIQISVPMPNELSRSAGSEGSK